MIMIEMAGLAANSTHDIMQLYKKWGDSVILWE